MCIGKPCLNIGTSKPQLYLSSQPTIRSIQLCFLAQTTHIRWKIFACMKPRHGRGCKPRPVRRNSPNLSRRTSNWLSIKLPEGISLHQSPALNSRNDCPDSIHFSLIKKRSTVNVGYVPKQGRKTIIFAVLPSKSIRREQRIRLSSVNMRPYWYYHANVGNPTPEDPQTKAQAVIFSNYTPICIDIQLFKNHFLFFCSPHKYKNLRFFLCVHFLPNRYTRKILFRMFSWCKILRQNLEIFGNFKNFKNTSAFNWTQPPFKNYPLSGESYPHPKFIKFNITWVQRIINLIPLAVIWSYYNRTYCRFVLLENSSFDRVSFIAVILNFWLGHW